MNLKKQRLFLYLYEGFVCFRMIDVVWVIFLLGRGYSLAQVGLAEGVFHAASMIFEVPTGMAADLFGRRRTLLFSCLAGVCSGLLMAADGWSGWIYLGMVCSALSFNLSSGTEEALTYDSLLEAGEAERYKKMHADMSVIGRVCSAAACTLSPVAIALGYRYTYLIAVLLNVCAALAVLQLTEPAVTETQKKRSENGFREIGVRMKRHISDTAAFILHHPRTMCKLLSDAAVACPCYLLMMYLQEHLVDCGWPQSWIGVPLLLLPLSGAVGAWLAARSRAGLFKTMLACGLLGGIGTCLAGSKALAVVLAGAGIARICEGYVEIAVSENVNRDFPSDQRATLISIDCMLYSVLMVAVSPLTGWLGSRYHVSVIFYVLGGGLALATLLCGAALPAVQRIRDGAERTPNK